MIKGFTQRLKNHVNFYDDDGDALKLVNSHKMNFFFDNYFLLRVFFSGRRSEKPKNLAHKIISQSFVNHFDHFNLKIYFTCKEIHKQIFVHICSNDFEDFGNRR